MRISGGTARGILLDVPQKGEVRPATDFSRERIFNQISSHINHTIVWACFAGTGAYGLEALSRGAKKCLFFEKDPQVICCLRKNSEKVCKSAQLNLQLSVQIFNLDVFSLPMSQLEAPDYIFFDPPYRFWEKYSQSIFDFFDKINPLFPKTQLVIEYPAQLFWPQTFLWKPLYSIKSTRKINAPLVNLFVFNPS